MVQKINLNDYRELIEMIAKVEFQRFSVANLIDMSELINIGSHALYILFKNHSPENYNSAYLATAIKWAIRNEVRRRYKWYTLKNRKELTEEQYDTNIREEVYKTILSIEEMQDAEVPSQIKSEERNPEENIEFGELKKEILLAMKKLAPREREFITAKFLKEKKLKDIADEYNISQSRISRVIQTGLDKIKKELIRQGII